MRSSITFPFDKPISANDLKVSFGVRITREDGSEHDCILGFDLVAIAEKLDHGRQRLEIDDVAGLGGTVTLRRAETKFGA